METKISFNGYVFRSRAQGIGKFANEPPTIKLFFEDDIFHKKQREKEFKKKFVRILKEKLETAKEELESLSGFKRLFHKKDSEQKIERINTALENARGQVANLRDISNNKKTVLMREMFSSPQHDGSIIFSPGTQFEDTKYSLWTIHSNPENLMINVHHTTLPTQKDRIDEVIIHEQTDNEHIMNILYNIDLIHSHPKFANIKSVTVIGDKKTYNFKMDDILDFVSNTEQRISNKFNAIEAITPKDIIDEYQKALK